jgi:DNA invertase Pin-like site-specific DNA recombinase
MTTSMTVPGGMPELLAAEPAGLTGARIGYARVSTNGQLLDRQLHALNEVGCIKVFADKQSGRDADRPDLIACLAYLRAGDTLVVPSLDRLARSLQDLVTLVSDLRRRGVGFRSLHEAIDTTTPGGRLVFHIFAALAEFIRELIVEGTHEGLAAAKGRGVKLGRPPALTPEQVRSARTLLAQPEHSVTSIAKLLGVSRSTIYKYVPELSGGSDSALPIATGPAAIVPAVDDPPGRPMPMPVAPKSPACPTCGHRPADARELQLHREGLETVWLVHDPDQPGRLVERWHCERCQPHQVEIVMCGLCGNTVMLGGDLAVAAKDQSFQLPDLAMRWLTDHGWIQRTSSWYCGNHPVRSSPQ